MREHRSEKYVPLKEVAARQEISEKYLEKNILKVLVQNGFLEGLRGKGGGYVLTRPPEQYTVGEILRLTEAVWHRSHAWTATARLLAFGRVSYTRRVEEPGQAH